MRDVVKVCLLSMVGISALGCGRGRPSATYAVIVRVTQAERPVAGATVVFRGQPVGTSQADGIVKLSIDGAEGEVYPLTVSCPEGFRSPARPIDVALRRFADPGAAPEYSVICQPLKRAVVVAIRAENGPNLPVLYLGEEVARTDASGAAHVLLTLAPEDEFELTLDTSEKEAERLRPQRPSAKFIVKNDEEIFSFYVPFVVEEKHAAPRPTRRAGGMPIRL